MFARFPLMNAALAGVIVLLGIYLYSPCFRLLLKNLDIDPNFIIGFLTVVALFLSLIQNKEDKKFSYNLLLVGSIEEKGLKIISKLIEIKNKSAIDFFSAKNCIQAIENKMVFKDLNNSLSKEKVESDMDFVVSCVNTYFPELEHDWNILIDKLNEIFSITDNILINYHDNLNVIHDREFRNSALDNADKNIKKAADINSDIEKITLQIRNKIVAKISKSKESFKNSFV